MKRATYRDMKPELARLAGASGFPVTDPRFLNAVNEAIEELMHEGDFPGVVDRYRFANYDGTITLPGDLERIMAIAVNYVPVEMRSPWYEFDAYGPGPQDSYSGLDVGLDRGEVATFRDIPSSGGPYKLRVRATHDERVNGERPTIIVRGYDSDGNWIRSENADGEWIDGVEFEINGDGTPKMVESTGNWIHVDSVLKPVTRGYVTLSVWDGTDEIVVSNYAPRETRPSYRRYFFPHLQVDQPHNVLMRCRRRFVPIIHDDDLLTFTNMSALKAMLLAHRKRDADKFQEYLALRATAVDLLTKEALSYTGKTIKPAITFSKGFGLGAVPHLQ